MSSSSSDSDSVSEPEETSSSSLCGGFSGIFTLSSLYSTFSLFCKTMRLEGCFGEDRQVIRELGWGNIICITTFFLLLVVGGSKNRRFLRTQNRRLAADLGLGSSIFFHSFEFPNNQNLLEFLLLIYLIKA